MLFQRLHRLSEIEQIYVHFIIVLYTVRHVALHNITADIIFNANEHSKFKLLLFF